MVWRRYMVLYLALMVPSAVLALWWSNWAVYDALLDRGISAHGFVTALDCGGRGQFKFKYRYEVNGRQFAGASNNGASKSCKELRIDDVVTIVYLPDEPSQSTGGTAAEVRELRDNVAMSAAFVAILIPGLFVAHIERKRRLTHDKERRS